MGSGLPSAGSTRLFVLISVLLLGLGPSVLPAPNEPPGGFIEKADSTAIRPLWTASQIQGFLPQRGRFTFPAPYGTEGIRLTNPTDCGGTDCLNYVGYSYWRNINNHVGSDTMLIFLGLDRNRGGAGPSLFSYNKITEEVKPLGPLFDGASTYSWRSGEGWYFSATQATKLYVFDGAKLLRYDVLAKTFEVVFDAAAQFGPDKYIWQTHSSNDDKVHSATLREWGTWATLGCLAYREDTHQFSYYPTTADFDECQIDKSGRWLVIKDNVDGIAGVDNRIIDLQTGTERLLLDQNGAGGHSDNGYGYMVATDNWNALPGAVRVWDFNLDPLQGPMVFHTTSWASDIGHIAHSNANAGALLTQQYACGGGVQPLAVPRQNEIVCFRLDTSQDVLVVTQNMTDLNATGGGDEYGKSPKGNLDVTGSYFIWTSNMGGNRLDAFIVKVPAHLLTGATPDTTPPTVSINEPAAGATLNGLVTVSALATDDVGVTSMQFSMDQVALSDAVAGAPYVVLWDTATVSNGSHALTAIARDAAGNSRVSTPVVITVNNSRAPLISTVDASSISTSGATIRWATDILSDSQVDYGPSVAYGFTTTADISLVSSHSQQLTALMPATPYHYRVKSRDAVGRLAVSGDFTFTTLASAEADVIFKDGFETGTVERWSVVSAGPGQLSVSAAAAMTGTSSGLEVTTGDQKNVYLQDDTPEDESRYRARFYLDPNGFDPGEATGTFRTRIFSGLGEAPIRQLVSIVLKRKAGQYSIMGSVLLDDLSQVDTPFFLLSNGPHSIEFDWRRASALGANDGAFVMWVDGAVVGTLTRLSNAAQGMDFVRIGAFGLKAEASGRFYWDEFESRRETYIGPLPSRP